MVMFITMIIIIMILIIIIVIPWYWQRTSWTFWHSRTCSRGPRSQAQTRRTHSFNNSPNQWMDGWLHIIWCTGCSSKNVPFQIHCNPPPACRRATHLIWDPIGWQFSVQPIVAQCCWRGRSRRALKTLRRKKTPPPTHTIFLNTLKYLFIFVIAFSLFGTTAAGGAPGGKVDVD